MAEQQKERWMQVLALTTTILAVCTAITSLKAGGCSTQVQLATTLATNKWSHFQSKSIKQHACEMERDTLGYYALQKSTPAQSAYVDQKILAIDKDIARYNDEKSAIEAQAKSEEKRQDSFKAIGAKLNLAVMLLQIAIMMSSVSALIKRPHLWYGGLLIGGVGLLYMALGLLSLAK